MRVRDLGILVVLLLSFAAVSATATVINFASLQSVPPSSLDTAIPGALTVPNGTSVTMQGFNIAAIGGGRLDVWQFGNANFPGTTALDTSLFDVRVNVTGAETQITINGTTPFTLNSIQVAPLLSGGSGPFTFVVTGVFPDSTMVTQPVTIQNSPFGLQTITFPTSFENVVAVAFTQGDILGTLGQPGEAQIDAYQFNNIVVNATSTVVPEPGTLVLLGSAFLSATGLIRRKLSR